MCVRVCVCRCACLYVRVDVCVWPLCLVRAALSSLCVVLFHPPPYSDCTGDEGCSVPIPERTNPMWGVVYIRRVFDTLASMAQITGEGVDSASTTMCGAISQVSRSLTTIVCI